MNLFNVIIMRNDLEHLLKIVLSFLLIGQFHMGIYDVTGDSLDLTTYEPGVRRPA